MDNRKLALEREARASNNGQNWTTAAKVEDHRDAHYGTATEYEQDFDWYADYGYRCAQRGTPEPETLAIMASVWFLDSDLFTDAYWAVRHGYYNYRRDNLGKP